MFTVERTKTRLQNRSPPGQRLWLSLVSLVTLDLISTLKVWTPLCKLTAASSWRISLHPSLISRYLAIVFVLDETVRDLGRFVSIELRENERLTCDYQRRQQNRNRSCWLHTTSQQQQQQHCHHHRILFYFFVSLSLGLLFSLFLRVILESSVQQMNLYSAYVSNARTGKFSDNV